MDPCPGCLANDAGNDDDLVGLLLPVTRWDCRAASGLFLAFGAPSAAAITLSSSSDRVDDVVLSLSTTAAPLSMSWGGGAGFFFPSEGLGLDDDDGVE